MGAHRHRKGQMQSKAPSSEALNGATTQEGSEAQWIIILEGLSTSYAGTYAEGDYERQGEYDWAFVLLNRPSPQAFHGPSIPSKELVTFRPGGLRSSTASIPRPAN